MLASLRFTPPPPAAGPLIELHGRFPAGGVSTARFPSYRLSFRYPSAWRRACTPSGLPEGAQDLPRVPGSGQDSQPVSQGVLLFELTTARPNPPCTNPTLPPVQRLGPNGVFVAWSGDNEPAGQGSRAPRFRERELHVLNGIVGDVTRVGGQPARITANWLLMRDNRSRGPLCPHFGRQRFRATTILGPGSWINVRAYVCGPNYTAGEAAVNQMLASTRFTR
jgi:hypothetical protein